MLTPEEVLKIAKLARLELTNEELKVYQGRLDRVLEYMNELKAVQTPAAAFVRHVPADAKNLRVDQAESFADGEAILKNAPAMEEGGFLIPTVLEV